MSVQKKNKAKTDPKDFGKSFQSMAMRSIRPRVLLVTDDPQLVAKVSENFRKHGIELSVVGFGNVYNQRKVRLAKPQIALFDSRIERNPVHVGITAKFRDLYAGVELAVMIEKPEKEIPYSDNPRNWGAAILVSKADLCAGNIAAIANEIRTEIFCSPRQETQRRNKEMRSQIAKRKEAKKEFKQKWGLDL